jgi:hypothetical protein
LQQFALWSLRALSGQPHNDNLASAFESVTPWRTVMDDRHREVLSVIREDLQVLASKMERLQSEIETLKNEARETAEELAELTRQEEFWSLRLREPSRAAAVTKSPDTIPHKSPSLSGDSIDKTHGEVAEEILKVASGPLSTKAIVFAMEKKGHPLPPGTQSRFNSVYSAMNRRQNTFLRLGNGFWGLVGRDEGHGTQNGGVSDTARTASSLWADLNEAQRAQ